MEVFPVVSAATSRRDTQAVICGLTGSSVPVLSSPRNPRGEANESTFLDSASTETQRVFTWESVNLGPRRMLLPASEGLHEVSASEIGPVQSPALGPG